MVEKGGVRERRMRRYYRPGVGGGGQRDVSIGTGEVPAAAVGENL